MPGLHTRTHPTFVDGCWACKTMSIRVDRGGAKVIDAKDRQLARDRDAYLRLRRDGLQPKHVDGARDLEGTVNSQYDIDLGHVVPPSEVGRVQEGYAMAKEMFPE